MIRLICLFAFVASAYKTASKFEKLRLNLELRQGSSCATASPLQSTTTSYNVSQTVSVGTSPTTLCRSATNNPAQVFYKYSPPTGTMQSLAFNTFGSGYDTMLAAYACSSCAGTPLTCIDDSNGTRQSAITVSNISDCVYLAVAGYGKAVGKLILTVQATATTTLKSSTGLAAAPTTCPSDYNTITEGAACAVSSPCTYEPVCCCPNAPNASDRQCQPTLTITCSNGAWGPRAAALINCAGAQCPSTTPAVCPDAAPTNGGSCTASQVCHYDGSSCCPDFDIAYRTNASCNGNAWSVASQGGIGCPPCSAACPPSSTSLPSSCEVENQVCRYDIFCCCGQCSYTTYATCHGGSWGVAQAMPGCPCRTATATPPTATPPTATPPTATSLIAQS